MGQNRRRHHTASGSDMQGMIGLGMKSQAFARARALFEKDPISGKDLDEALEAILSFEHRAQRKFWEKKIEAAFKRMPRKDVDIVRFKLMMVRAHYENHEGVLELMTNPVTGEYAAMQVAMIFNSALELEREDIIPLCYNPAMEALRRETNRAIIPQITLALAEYHARRHEWDRALLFLESIKDDFLVGVNAVINIIEIHNAQALLAIREGRKYAEKYRDAYEPKSELRNPGESERFNSEALRDYDWYEAHYDKMISPDRQRILRLTENDAEEDDE